MTESVEISVKYAAIMLLLLMVVFVIALLTPIIARYITKLIEKSAFKDSEKNNDIYKVKSIYDAQKIINGDEKNGKEQ